MDRFGDGLVVLHEPQTQPHQVGQLHHDVESHVRLGLGRLLLFGLHVALEEALREHEDLAADVRTVVEPADVETTSSYGVRHHGDVANIVNVIADLDVIDTSRRSLPLKLTRDTRQVVDLGKPARLGAGDQISHRVAEGGEGAIDRVHYVGERVHFDLLGRRATDRFSSRRLPVGGTGSIVASKPIASASRTSDLEQPLQLRIFSTTA